MKMNMGSEDYFSTDVTKRDLKIKAMKGAGVSVIASTLIHFIHFIATVVLARLLTPHDFGLVTMVTSFSLLLQNCGLNGFTEAIIQGREINHNKISTIFWVNVGLSFLLTLFLISIAPLISWFYGEPNLTPITIAMSSSILFTGLLTIHMSLLKRNMHYSQISIINILVAFVSNSVAISFALLDCGVWSLVFRRAIEPFAVCLGAWLFCQWRPGRPVWNSGINSMVKFAISTYGNFVLNYFSRNGDKILIGKYVGSRQLGLYDRAYYLSSMPADQLVTPITSVALSTLSRIQNNHQEYIRYYLKILSSITFVGLPLSFILTLCGKDLVVLILGIQWAETGYIFTILSAGIGISLIYLTHGWLHLSLGTPHRWFLWGIIEIIVKIVFITLGLQFGIRGVAVSLVIASYVLFAPGLWYAGKSVYLRLSLIFKSLIRYFLAAFVSLIICWWILYQNSLTVSIYSELDILPRIIIAFILYVTIYCCLIIAFFRGLKPITEFVLLLRGMISNVSFTKSANRNSNIEQKQMA